MNDSKGKTPPTPNEAVKSETRPSWVPKGGTCSEHGPYEVGPDCPGCIREVLEWTS